MLTSLGRNLVSAFDRLVKKNLESCMDKWPDPLPQLQPLLFAKVGTLGP